MTYLLLLWLMKRKPELFSPITKYLKRPWVGEGNEMEPG